MEQQANSREQPTNRRRLFKLIGAVGASAAAAPLMPGLLAQAATSSASQTTAAARSRQWTMVIDLRKCEGCVVNDKPPACVDGCNLEHFVPGDQEWITIAEVEGPGGHFYFMPRLCMQCENPPCVKVCPVGATYPNGEGVVLINHERCIGCRMCMVACPYGARSFNWEQPENPPGAVFAEYSPEYPIPHRTGTVNKCMLCAHRIEDGKLPACAEACPMFAIYLGDLSEDIATNGKEVVKLSRFLAENNAFRLREELGTRPRVWYLPGYGQEYGREVDDRRKPARARRWHELQAGSEHAHEGVLS